MRRSEFTYDTQEEFDSIVNTAMVGYLGIVDGRGFPRVIPLNFSCIGKTIYFHGANEGEKWELLKESPKVTFSVDVPFSYIPSWFTSPKNATPASHLFKSLLIRGIGLVVDDLDEKARGLQAMMEKYQPEGRHEKVEAENRIYTNQLKQTGVFKVELEEFSIKNKFLQNYSPDKRQIIVDHLRERGLEIDLKSIDLIEYYRPKDQQTT